MIFIQYILGIVIGYIVGSIPWALIIGKVFYKKDIREYGSGNLGGTNAGRVLGKKAGIAVIVLDALKAFFVMMAFNFIFPSVVPYAGLAVSVGHCFPLFAQFKGGKGVACAAGYLLGLSVFGFQDPFFGFIYPVLIFFLILGLSKMVSLSSMIFLLSATVISFITSSNTLVNICIALLTVFVIYRHIPNIKKIIAGKENKVTWIK